MDLEGKILSEHVPKEPHPPEFFNKITVPPPAVEIQVEDAAEASSGTRIKRTSCCNKESVRRKARRVIVQSKKSKK